MNIKEVIELLLVQLFHQDLQKEKVDTFLKFLQKLQIEHI